MKYSNYLSIVVFALLLVAARFVPANAIQCKTCSEDTSCQTTQHPSDWQTEDCPSGDHQCNLVYEKTIDGHIKLIYGGCTNNRLNICSKDTKNNEICIATCEGDLCNSSIKFS